MRPSTRCPTVSVRPSVPAWSFPRSTSHPGQGLRRIPRSLRREYVDYITKDILDRAITLGFPAVQLENEHIFQMVNDPKKFEQTGSGWPERADAEVPR